MRTTVPPAPELTLAQAPCGAPRLSVGFAGRLAGGRARTERHLAGPGLSRGRALRYLLQASLSPSTGLTAGAS